VPTADEHIKKYEKNKELLNKEVFDIHNTGYKEWVVTIAFYSALHLVEYKFYKDSKLHTGNHKARLTNVRINKAYRDIRSDYKYLYDQSIKARYTADIINKDDTKEAIKSLHRIESKIIS